MPPPKKELPYKRSFRFAVEWLADAGEWSIEVCVLKNALDDSPMWVYDHSARDVSFARAIQKAREWCESRMRKPYEDDEENRQGS